MSSFGIDGALNTDGTSRKPPFPFTKTYRFSLDNPTIPRETSYRHIRRMVRETICPHRHAIKFYGHSLAQVGLCVFGREIDGVDLYEKPNQRIFYRVPWRRKRRYQSSDAEARADMNHIKSPELDLRFYFLLTTRTTAKNLMHKLPGYRRQASVSRRNDLVRLY